MSDIEADAILANTDTQSVTSNEYEKLRKENESLRKECNEWKETGQQLTEENDGLKEKCRTLKNECHVWEEKYEELNKKCQEMNKRIEVLQKEMQYSKNEKKCGDMIESFSSITLQQGDNDGKKQHKAPQTTSEMFDTKQYVNEDMCFFIQKEIVKERKNLGRHLKLTEPELDAIEYNNKDDAQECTRQIMEKWRRKEGLAATVDILIKALRDIERNDIVNKLVEKFKQNPAASNPLSYKPSGQKCAGSSSEPTVQVHQERRSEVYNSGMEVDHLPDSSLEIFFSCLLKNPPPEGMEEFKNSLDEVKDFNLDQTKKISKVMSWQDTLVKKFDTDVMPNLKVINVLEKWTAIVLSENGEMNMEAKKTKIKTLCRALRSKQNKLERREDIVKTIREHIIVGCVGTKEPPNTSYCDLSFETKFYVVKELNLLNENGGIVCSQIATKLGLDNETVRYIPKENPGKFVLRSWETQRDATVLKLYKVLVELGLYTAAAKLE